MLLFAALLTAAQLPPAAAANGVASPAPSTCPRTMPHYAWDSGKPLKPQKLTELPPGQGYMAVYRTVDGCEYPMTMIEYRTQGRRR